MISGRVFFYSDPRVGSKEVKDGGKGVGMCEELCEDGVVRRFFPE